MKAKNIILLLYITLLISCNTTKEPDPNWKEKFLPDVKTTTTIQELDKRIGPHTPKKQDKSNSYWFVVIEQKDGKGKQNAFVKIEHPYFSYIDAMDEFGGTNKVFLLNFVEVSQITWLRANTRND